MSKEAYVMALNIANQSSLDLKPLGSAFYDGDGAVQQPSQLIKVSSTGSGGVLEKATGSDGLFGLIAYTTPDINKTLVIYTQMPATSGKTNRTWVGLVQAGTKVDDNLANSCYSGPPGGFSEGKIYWAYSQDGQNYLLSIEPIVKDPHAYNTSTLITLARYTRD